MRRGISIGIIALLCLLAASPAYAELPAPEGTHLVLTAAQLWPIVLGAITPLASYVINSKLWSEAPEILKALVQLFVAAVVGAIWAAVATPAFGFNDQTLQLVITTVIANFGSHLLVWERAHVNIKLGARPRYTDAPGVPITSAQKGV